MNLTLYHSAESTCAQKVRIVLATKRLHWHEVRLNLRKGEQFSPEYLRLNPKAVVPTLVHDEVAIRESTVINEYLEDCFPDVPLLAGNPLARARTRLLVKSIDDEVHPAIGVLSYAIFLRHQMNARMSAQEVREHFRKVADPARRERQQATHEMGLESPSVALSIRVVKRFVGELADALDGRKWLVGERFSLADAAAVPYMVRAQDLRLSPLWDDCQHVGRWLQRAIDEASGLPLADVFGSVSFRAMVARHADAEASAILELLDDM